MANARANIYPVQLQGAELNLNKYDAEIKQYSGFNKNNSPFVGGCLSNIYKKDVSIDGETFIDKKGNVYSVDTEGVYLNDQKLINYSEHTRFYKKTKLNVSANAVMAISEDVYITYENNLTFPYPMSSSSYEERSGYVAHWGNGYSQILSPDNTDTRVQYDIVKKGNIVVFTCKRGVLIQPQGSSYIYRDFLYTVIVPDINNADCKYYNPSTTVSWASGWFGCSRTYGLPGVYITDNEILLSLNTPTDYGVYIFNLDGTMRTVNGYRQPVLNFIYSTSSNDNKPPLETGCWHMTNDGFLYFYNTVSNFTLPSSSSRIYFYCTAKILSVADTNITIKPQTYFDLVAPSSKVVSTTGGGVSAGNLLTPYIAMYILTLVNTADTSKFYAYSGCGTFQNAAIDVRSTTYATVTNQNGVCFFGDFKILVNNGYVSNISIAEFERDQYGNIGPFGNGSLNGVILEDWNTISALLITEEGTKAVYKKADGFYTIERTATPKFSLKYNQLVVNCNNEYNSINIDTREILHFGTDWNDSYLTTPGFGGDSSTYIYDSGYNYSEMYVASAVNEYKLENNASILLNPRRVNLKSDVPNIMTGTGAQIANIFCRNYISNGVIDFFSGSLATEVIFVASSTRATEHTSELVGLPFPTDANGNVLYNAPLFSEFISTFSNDVFVRIDNDAYALHKNNNHLIMSFYLGTLVEGLETLFILQGQYYGIINQQLFSIQMSGGVVVDMVAIVSVQGLQFVGNTPYEALFFSKTNRCLYSFTGANVLNQKQLIDKISEVRNYLYNPATQTVFLITDIGVLFYGLFGIYLLEYEDITQVYLLLDGVVLGNDSGNYHYIKYYLEEGDTDYTKENINVETSFYGMNNEVVTINDCLYFRIFSEEHEEGDLKVSATTISLSGRKTEETTFKIKASDWDKITHTIYLRYQPKTQRGLGVAFAIDSPFKIASMSVGSQPDAVLVDKVSKGAITAPSVTTNNNEW